MLFTLLIGLSLALLGAILLKRGWWPKRVGETAHCPKCDYILSGDQLRCPECGTFVNSAIVARGERHRRYPLAFAGGAIGFLGLLGLVGIIPMLLNGSDWNRHKPLGWLLRDLDSGGSPAWSEIQRRIDASLLSEGDQDVVVERGLVVQGKRTSYGNRKNVVDFVGDRYLQGKLTASQADRFFTTAMNAQLLVRAVVGSQSRVPFAIKAVGNGPQTWSRRISFVGYQLDDGPVEQLSTSTYGGFSEWPNTTIVRPPVPTLGVHRLRVTVSADAASRYVNWDNSAVSIKHLTQNLSAAFEVVEGRTPIAAVTEPGVEVLRPHLGATLTFNPIFRSKLNAAVKLDDWLAVDLAFGVYVRFNGVEYPVGGALFQKGLPGQWGTEADNFPAEAPSKVDVILRSSEATAGETVDMTQIWKGEIVLRDVPLARLTPPPPASGKGGPATRP